MSPSPWRLGDLTEAELVQWIASSIAEQKNIHARGYQGIVYRFQGDGLNLIVKAVSGGGPLNWLRRVTLGREYQVYQKLRGFPGSPICYGLLQGRYLVLQYVEGTVLRGAANIDRRAFFSILFQYIQELHGRGIAHGDLKRPDNLLVAEGHIPYIIDFGAAIVRKPGFAPINHYLFKLARQFDLNAWVKLKYQGKWDEVSAADRVHFKRTPIEKIARWIREAYLKLKLTR